MYPKYRKQILIRNQDRTIHLKLEKGLKFAECGYLIQIFQAHQLQLITLSDRNPLQNISHLVAVCIQGSVYGQAEAQRFYGDLCFVRNVAVRNTAIADSV